MSKMKKLWHYGQPVLTTEQVADILGTDPKYIQKNYQRNAKRYIEGKHYYRLTGEELATAKKLLGDDQLTVKLTPSSLQISEEPDAAGLWLPEPSIDKYAPHLMLWTRRGLIRHVKSVNTDAAWGIYDRMEEVYFRVFESEPPKVEAPKTAGDLGRSKAKYWRGEQVWTMQDVLELLPGLTKNQLRYTIEMLFTDDDAILLSGAQLQQFKRENGTARMCKALWLVKASGLTKLSSYYNVSATAVTVVDDRITKAVAALQAALQALTA